MSDSAEDDIPLPSVGVLSEEETAGQVREDLHKFCRQENLALKARAEKAERALTDAQCYGQIKDETATTFMQQVKKLQAQLSSALEEKEKAEAEFERQKQVTELLCDLVNYVCRKVGGLSIEDNEEKQP